MTRGYCGQCGGPYSDGVPCECQQRAGMSVLLTDKQVRDLIRTEIKLAEEFHEVLEALETALGFLQEINKLSDSSLPNPRALPGEIDDVMEEIAKVIAKAKGEQG